jgi:hypothetical protein
MANPIVKVKRSETALAVPTLTYGELGVNITDKKIYVGNSSNTAILLNVSGGGGGSSITVSDDTTTDATRYIVFEDVTSGDSTSINVSSTKLTFNPLTGVLSAVALASTIVTGTAPFTVTSTTQVTNLNAQLHNGLLSATTGANTIVRTDGSGNLAASGNVTAYSSDRRLKENFNHIESPIEKIQKLNGYTFDWNEKSKELGFIPKHEKNDIGLIAQEVEEVLPQATAPAPFDLDENGESKSGENYLTIQYERLVPLLIEAIKEQQETINMMKGEIEILKLKIVE